MKELLEWIQENKYYLDKDGNWYSSKNYDYIKGKFPTFTHEQLIEKYEKDNKLV